MGVLALIIWGTEKLISIYTRGAPNYSVLKFFEKDSRRFVCILVKSFHNNTTQNDKLDFVYILFQENKYDTITLFCSMDGYNEHQAHIEQGYHFDVDSINDYLGDYDKKSSKSFKSS